MSTKITTSNEVFFFVIILRDYYRKIESAGVWLSILQVIYQYKIHTKHFIIFHNEVYYDTIVLQLITTNNFMGFNCFVFPEEKQKASV